MPSDPTTISFFAVPEPVEKARSPHLITDEANAVTAKGCVACEGLEVEACDVALRLEAIGEGRTRKEGLAAVYLQTGDEGFQAEGLDHLRSSRRDAREDDYIRD